MNARRIPPQAGQHVTVRWPGGPYDFTVEFGYEEQAGTHSSTGDEPWVVVHGAVVEPRGRGPKFFYARRTGAFEYTMLPHKG